MVPFGRKHVRVMHPKVSERAEVVRDDLIRKFTGMRASVLGYLRVLVRDPHPAEDLYQGTCLIVLKKLQEFDGTGDFGAWVRAIVLNLARNAMRKEKYLRPRTPSRLAAAIERAHAGGGESEAATVSAELDRLERCLERVELRQKELLALQYRRRGADLIVQRRGRRRTPCRQGQRVHTMFRVDPRQHLPVCLPLEIVSSLGKARTSGAGLPRSTVLGTTSRYSRTVSPTFRVSEANSPCFPWAAADASA